MRRSFTIIELMLVIGIIGTLSGIVIGAVNPSMQLTAAKDAQRRTATRELGNAITQYLIDNGTLPDSDILPTSARNPMSICKAGNSNTYCWDVSNLTPDYIVEIPVDPAEPADSTTTGYAVYRDGANRVTVTALHLSADNTGGPTDYVSRWNFEDGEGTTASASYPELNGMLTNMDDSNWITNTPSVLSDSDYSLEFNGVNEYVDLGSSSLLNPTTVSVSMWFKPDVMHARSLWSNSRDCCGTYNGLNIDLYSSTIRFRNWNAVVSNLQTSAVTTDTWQHLVVTYDNPEKKIYLNGNLIANGTTPLGIGEPASFNTYIGRLGINAWLYDGLIDDVRLYARALTASEVAALAAGN